MRLQGSFQNSSVIYQLLFLLLYALCGALLSILLMWLSGIAYTGSWEKGMTQTAIWMNNPSCLKLFQGINTVFTFALPALVLYYMRDEFLFVSTSNRKLSYWLLWAWMGMWCFMPGITWLESWNKSIELPASWQSLELWFQSMEANAADATERLLSSNDSWIGYLTNMLLISLMAGVAEEIFFRGALQKALQEKINFHIAIWVTAFIFSAIHFQFYGFIPRMILGAWLGYLFYFSGNIWIPILAHAVNNGTAVTADALSRNGYFVDMVQWLENCNGPMIGWISLIVVIGITMWIRKSCQSTLSR